MIRTALISLMILCALGIGAGNSILSAAENTQDVIAELRTQIQELQQEMAALKEMIRPLVEENYCNSSMNGTSRRHANAAEGSGKIHTGTASEIETLYRSQP